jgi:large subunit ribosomal protein L10
VAITKEKKAQLLEEYAQALEGSQCVYLANYSGATVEQMERVRRTLRQENASLEVLRNALFAIAARQAGNEILAEAPQGATLAIFCKGDPSSPAKSLGALAREVEAFKVYGGVFGSRLLAVQDVAAIANLPSREVLLAQVVGGLQSPIYGFVGVLSGVLRSLLYVLQARTDQMQAPASAEAA